MEVGDKKQLAGFVSPQGAGAAQDTKVETCIRRDSFPLSQASSSGHKLTSQYTEVNQDTFFISKSKSNYHMSNLFNLP